MADYEYEKENIDYFSCDFYAYVLHGIDDRMY